MKLQRKKNCGSLNFVGDKRGKLKLLNFLFLTKKRLPANDEEFERN